MGQQPEGSGKSGTNDKAGDINCYTDYLINKILREIMNSNLFCN